MSKEESNLNQQNEKQHIENAKCGNTVEFI